jgi:hypothetical protein
MCPRVVDIKFRACQNKQGVQDGGDRLGGGFLGNMLVRGEYTAKVGVPSSMCVPKHPQEPLGALAHQD